MTPVEMVRHLTFKIETSLKVMEDGATGWVLHTDDGQRCLCMRRGAVWLDTPLADDLAVLRTYVQALSLRHYWNSRLTKDDPPGLEVHLSLRREVLHGYINIQQAALDMLLSTGEQE